MCSISVCIITKNEDRNLEICLSRLSRFNFEIIVVDTGSSDNSVEVAKRYTDNVFEFPWIDDFSAARNYAIEKASGEYILTIDTDEFVDEVNEEELYTLIQSHPNDLGKVHLKNLYVSDGVDMISHEHLNRLFNKRKFFYSGSVHEQITPLAGNNLVFSTYIAPIYITHTGYKLDSDSRKIKAERNLKLLMKEYELRPDDTYLLYQIGKAYFFDQNYNKAVEYFEKAFEYQLDVKRIYVQQLVISYAYSMISLKQYKKAVALESIYDDFSNYADYLFVMGLIYMNNARFDDAISSFLKATSIENCSVEGVNSYLAFYNIGVIYECLGKKDQAIQYYRKCKDYTLAETGIERCLNG